jgi:hypothetical protein
MLSEADIQFHADCIRNDVWEATDARKAREGAAVKVQ